MNIVDVIILGFFIISIYNGFRRGVVNSVVTLVGTIAVFILSFYLKAPVSIFMYEHLPFISLKGIFENVTVINILIYEAISFVLTFLVLSILVKILARVTGLVDKVLGKLVLLGLPSKILGAVVGLLQGYLFIFLILFAISSFAKPSKYIEESKVSAFVLTKTPILSDIVGDTVKSVKEVYDICLNNKDANQANLESLNVLMKYEILNYESAKNLLDTGKLNIENADAIIDKYKEDNYDQTFRK